MRILVTGGAGYIGSQLIRDLGRDPRFAGACIVIYDSMRDERYQSLMELPDGVCYGFIGGDIKDLDGLTAAMADCDVVVHLAALTNAVVSFDRIAETEAINFTGTENVVVAALHSPRVRRVLYASTCSVYGETSGLVDEDSECNPESPYAINKLEG
ncbi:MAG: NAD-dependent epimerase/dehydratase family protein, partial [Chloroflexota bacterium]|nr:NAD-dependent epimerase/dehydratase family protein [Chloroflexota bacterium]